MYIQRSLPMASTDLKFNADKGSFKGYASVWDGVDSYMDTIVKGAYADTLAKNGLPKMFYQHAHDMPIGKYTDAGEDSKGFWVEGELTPGHSLATDVRAALKHGTLDGLSVGGYIAKGDYTIMESGGRLIKKWTELAEVSPVVWPADKAARIDHASVKSVDFELLLPECKSEKDIERLLRDAGLSKWDARAIVSQARIIIKGRDAQDDDEAENLAAVVKRLEAFEKIGA